MLSIEHISLPTRASGAGFLITSLSQLPFPLGTPLNDVQRRFAKTVRISGEALLAIINDILDFSKIETGKLELETIDFDLRQIVEDIHERYCQVNGLRAYLSRGEGVVYLLCRFLDARHLRPRIERFSTSHPILGGRDAMAAQVEEIVDGAVSR
jgi:signal transduction histidine kinase